MTFTRSNVEEIKKWFASQPQAQECHCYTEVCSACSFVSFLSLSSEKATPGCVEARHAHPGLKASRRGVRLSSSHHP